MKDQREAGPLRERNCSLASPTKPFSTERKKEKRIRQTSKRRGREETKKSPVMSGRRVSG